MGASNFHTVNAYNTYAVLMDYEQETFDDEGNVTGTESVSADYWDTEDLISNLTYSAKEKIKDLPFTFGDVHSIDPHELRSYSSRKLFCLTATRELAECNIHLEINCVLRSAYYEGATLDWYITDSLDDLDIEQTIKLETYLPIGMIKIQTKHVTAWYEKTKQQLIDTVEEIFRENSTPLTVAARFSNGETIYQKAS